MSGIRRAGGGQKLGCDASGGKNNAQGWGSAISYGKRYTSFALLNLVGTDDKDADAAPPLGETITEEQENAIRDLIEATESDPLKFCAYFKIERLPDLPAAKYDAAIMALKKKGR